MNPPSQPGGALNSRHATARRPVTSAASASALPVGALPTGVAAVGAAFVSPTFTSAGSRNE